MTLFEDFQIAETVFADIAQFAAGQPIALAPKKIGGYTISGSSQILPNGPTAQFPAVSGVANMLVLGFEAVSGQPVSVGEKIGNTWIGYTLQVTRT